MSENTRAWGGTAWWWALGVVLLGLVLRVMNMPARYEVRDGDDLQYMTSGLAMWEGLVPGTKASPSAPETWMTWAYIAADSAYHFVRPAADQPRVPMAVRPYVTVDWALFKTNEDLSQLHQYLIWCQILIACGAIYWAFRLGWHWGGTVGGIIAGVTIACFPVFIEYSAMTRPYSDGWAFGITALGSVAVLRGRRRWIQGGLLWGLAIGARIDMVALLPFMAWLLWEEREAGKTFWRRACELTGGTALTVMLVDPWFLTNLIGNLRVIATMQLSNQFRESGVSPLRTLLTEMLVYQGAGILLVLAVGLVFSPREKRMRYAVVAVVALLLAGTIVARPDKPIRYQGVPFEGIWLTGILGAAMAIRRWPKMAWGMAGVVAAAGLAQGSRQVALGRSFYPMTDGSVAWVEEHVPPGTRVYLSLSYFYLRPPLPTDQASEALWNEIADQNSWRRKFEHGLSRFKLDLASVPRALSEENLIPERSFSRRWFILGNTQYGGGRPRYDVRLAYDSPTFWITGDLEKEYEKTGGVILCWSDEHKLKNSEPLVQWTSGNGHGTYLYCSPDVKAKLLNYQNAK